jgi:hypothetical protein
VDNKEKSENRILFKVKSEFKILCIHKGTVMSFHENFTKGVIVPAIDNLQTIGWKWTETLTEVIQDLQDQSKVL